VSEHAKTGSEWPHFTDATESEGKRCKTALQNETGRKITVLEDLQTETGETKTKHF
jgi:hypothetical protein